MNRAAVVVAILLCIVQPAGACVGKLLSIGVVDSAEGRVLSEVLSVLITERTGTAVKVTLYRNTQELYDAVRVKKVDISVENTSNAMRFLNRAVEADANRAYEYVKAAYEKEMGLIWLKPFGFQMVSDGGPSQTAAIVRTEVLNNFPALPRVINKLGGSITDETYARLIASVESGEKARKAARDFLKSKKLI